MIQNEQEMKQMIEQILRCEEEIGKSIIGQKAIIRQMIIAILTDGNVLLEGVPGVGITGVAFCDCFLFFCLRIGFNFLAASQRKK